jgi:hypothetical protein
MRAIEAAIIGVRIIALVVLTGLINSIVKIVENWASLRAFGEGLEVPGGTQTVFIAAVQIGLIVGVGVLLFIYAEKIARRILPSIPVTDQQTSTSNIDWVRLILGFMGVWLILTSFPQLLGNTISMLVLPEAQLQSYIQRATLTELIQFIAGCLMLLWRRLIDFFRSLLFFQSSESQGVLRVSVSSTNCPYCKEAMEGQERWICRQCGSQHHQVCWMENEGCAVFGCPSVRD